MPPETAAPRPAKGHRRNPLARSPHVRETRPETAGTFSTERGPMSDERIQIMRRVALFDGLSDKELSAVAGAAKERRYDTGDTIVSEGESGVGFFVIADGTARVEAHG